MQDRERGESLASETAVLVRVILPNQRFEDDPLEELEGLATTAGTHVVCGLTQRRESADATTFIGKGKVEELARLVETHNADVVIFDNDLSPGQTRNLEKAIGVKVIDRTELILDIFATHAQTYEARLAVELAQLEYSLPRLKRMWTHLSRMKLGVGMRGPGEKQLEEDRRLVEKRIHDLRDELHEIELRKERQVAARNAHMTVSLVGYTNAGKSTLMNALTDAGVLVEDKLFATLDTRTRRWQLPNWGPVLLSDTVGFHSPAASPLDRQLQGDPGRGSASRPAPACGRRQQSGRLRSDLGRLRGTSRNRHRRKRPSAGPQQDRPRHWGYSNSRGSANAIPTRYR